MIKRGEGFIMHEKEWSEGFWEADDVIKRAALLTRQIHDAGCPVSGHEQVMIDLQVMQFCLAMPSASWIPITTTIFL